jgi:hypothetical protein
VREKDDYPNSNQSKLQDTLKQCAVFLHQSFILDMHSHSTVLLRPTGIKDSCTGIIDHVERSCPRHVASLFTSALCSQDKGIWRPPGTLSWDPQLGLSAPQARAGSGCSTTAQQLPAACYRIPRISIDSFHQRPRQNWFPKGVVVLSCCHEPGHTDPCTRVRRVIRRREGKLGAEPTAGNPAM